MNKHILLVSSLFLSTAAFAQNTTTAAPKPTPAGGKPVISGSIVNSRNQPIQGAEAFVYADSAIIASGYTDEGGKYVTNSVTPGNHNIKVVFPNNKNLMITGVLVKGANTTLNIKLDPPANDTTMTYAEVMPKAVNKRK